ncbi:MAG: signal peptide peptidase SppA [Verrucomicrobiota bacterium]
MENVPPNDAPVTPPVPPAQPPVLPAAPILPPSPPPRLPTPPLLTPPLAAPRKTTGRGWRTLAIVLLCVVGGIMLLNVGSFITGAFRGASGMSQDSEPHFIETVVEDNDGTDKIALISLEGIIHSGPADGSGVSMARLIKKQLKLAAEDKHVKAVILRVDSPGGEVLPSDEIAKEIQKFQKESSKPVIASMGSLAASGGYYVSAPCKWIVAHELTITGSIGVIMHGYNYRGLMNKVGIAPEVYKSGRFKDMLSGDKDLANLTEAERKDRVEEQAMVQSLIKEVYDRFKGVVAKGRDGKLNSEWATYADGRILSGIQAKELGFVDELGTFETAVKRAETLAGCKDAKLIQYQVPFDFLNVMRLLGKTEAPAIKIDLGVEISKIKTGRMYFLSPVLLP